MVRRSAASRSVTLLASLGTFVALAISCGGALAAPPADSTVAKPGAATADDTSSLRICAAANQLPFSSRDGSGFENKIATIVAEAMGRKPVFVWADKPAIYLVRDWLDKKRCDVVVGLDTGDPRVLTTAPYYRAGYVFLAKKGDERTAVSSWNDPKVKKLGHIAVELGSPSEEMLKELGLYNDDMAYLYSLVGFRAPRNEYVQIAPARMIAEVKDGNADLAVAFAPDVARLVKSDPDIVMTPVKDDTTHNGGEKLPQLYDQSMGVRRGDETLRAALNDALAKAKPQIDAALQSEGIPLTASGK